MKTHKEYNKNLAFLFGDDLNPFCAEINFEINNQIYKGAPIGLKLLGYQSGAKIGVNKYILCGGVDHKFTKISKEVYLFNSRKYIGYPLANMKRARYCFSSVYKGDYLYVIGGRDYGNEKESFMPYCERFNINTRKWETISQLNEARYQALAFSVGDCIYVAGGLIYDKNPRSNSIEKYDI